MDGQFERLKSELMLAGMPAVEDFLGFKIPDSWGKDAVDNAMDEVYQQMPEEELGHFYRTYLDKEDIL